MATTREIFDLNYLKEMKATFDKAKENSQDSFSFDKLDEMFSAWINELESRCNEVDVKGLN